ncbi:MAG: SUMF1/EgtB/PvdO family nonheme iron enzyme [Planctomycetia bacterium]|nr:SUMF1/EgtB/PvdO family nonheme iron enzyme [Planctomycetia bacterium]
MNKFFGMLSVSLLACGLFLNFVSMPVPCFAADEEEVAATTDGETKKTVKKKKKSTKAKAVSEDDSEKTAETAADDEDGKVKKSTKKTKKTKKVKKADAEEGAEDTEKAVAEDEAEVKTKKTKKKSSIKADDAEEATDADNADEKVEKEVADEEKENAEDDEKADAIVSADASALAEPGKKAGETRDITVGDVTYTFCWCPAGTFEMGAPEDELGYSEAEKLHTVKLSKGFWMLQSEVTQKMYSSVTGTNPSYFSVKGFGKDKGNVSGREETDNFPVDRVSYGDAVAFCAKLSEICGIQFRLPTEAQWEYACRAGTSYSFYTDKAPTAQQANYKVGDNVPESTDEVGKHGQNPWNLYDMMGNVNEWCLDYYDAEYYANSPATDPMGPDSVDDEKRVLRGGSFSNMAYYCRSATRNSLLEAAKGNRYDGFRFVTVPGGDAPTADAEEANVKDADEEKEADDADAEEE